MNEQEFLATYDPNKYVRPVGVPADIAIFTITSEAQKGKTKGLPKRALKVMLIRRGGHPDKGKWALPGGFSSPSETLLEAAHRELLEETGVDSIHVERFGVYDTPGRDKRGWVISVAHFALVHEKYLGKRKAADDASDVQLFTIEEALSLDLAFDHHQILSDAYEAVQKKILQSTIAKEFLNKEFTLAELYQVIQTVVPTYSEPIPNFIRKLVYSKNRVAVIEEVEGKTSTKYSQRPAKLYRFLNTEPKLSIY